MMILALGMLAACSLDHSGDEECATPNPGCPNAASCPGACGRIVYECLEGEWEPVLSCDQCLAVPPVYPGTWRITQALDPATTCDLDVRAEVLLTVGYLVGREFAMLTPDDPDLVITSNSAWIEISGDACLQSVSIEATDVVQLDGVDSAATLIWDLDFARTAPAEITGSFSGQADSCTFNGTITGTFELTSGT